MAKGQGYRTNNMDAEGFAAWLDEQEKEEKEREKNGKDEWGFKDYLQTAGVLLAGAALLGIPFLIGLIALIAAFFIAKGIIYKKKETAEKVNNNLVNKAIENSKEGKLPEELQKYTDMAKNCKNFDEYTQKVQDQVKEFGKSEMGKKLLQNELFNNMCKKFTGYSAKDMVEICNNNKLIDISIENAKKAEEAKKLAEQEKIKQEELKNKEQKINEPSEEEKKKEEKEQDNKEKKDNKSENNKIKEEKEQEKTEDDKEPVNDSKEEVAEEPEVENEGVGSKILGGLKKVGKTIWGGIKTAGKAIGNGVKNLFTSKDEEKEEDKSKSKDEENKDKGKDNKDEGITGDDITKIFMAFIIAMFLFGAPFTLGVAALIGVGIAGKKIYDAHQNGKEATENLKKNGTEELLKNAEKGVKEGSKQVGDDKAPEIFEKFMKMFQNKNGQFKDFESFNKDIKPLAEQFIKSDIGKQILNSDYFKNTWSKMVGGDVFQSIEQNLGVKKEEIIPQKEQVINNEPEINKENVIKEAENQIKENEQIKQEDKVQDVQQQEKINQEIKQEQPQVQQPQQEPQKLKVEDVRHSYNEIQRGINQPASMKSTDIDAIKARIDKKVKAAKPEEQQKAFMDAFKAESNKFFEKETMDLGVARDKGGKFSVHNEVEKLDGFNKQLFDYCKQDNENLKGCQYQKFGGVEEKQIAAYEKEATKKEQPKLTVDEVRHSYNNVQRTNHSKFKANNNDILAAKARIDKKMKGITDPAKQQEAFMAAFKAESNKFFKDNIEDLGSRKDKGQNMNMANEVNAYDNYNETFFNFCKQDNPNLENCEYQKFGGVPAADITNMQMEAMRPEKSIKEKDKEALDKSKNEICQNYRKINKSNGSKDRMNPKDVENMVKRINSKCNSGTAQEKQENFLKAFKDESNKFYERSIQENLGILHDQGKKFDMAKETEKYEQINKQMFDLCKRNNPDLANLEFPKFGGLTEEEIKGFQKIALQDEKIIDDTLKETKTDTNLSESKVAENSEISTEKIEIKEEDVEEFDQVATNNELASSLKQSTKEGPEHQNDLNLDDLLNSMNNKK